MAFSGQICEACGHATYIVYSSFLSDSGDYQVQYLRCGCCKHRPEDNKVVVPEERIRRRTTLLRNRLNLKRRS